jgi:hypothetical protein
MESIDIVSVPSKGEVILESFLRMTVRWPFLPIRHDRGIIRNARGNNIRVALIAAGNDYALPGIRFQAE